MTKITLKELRDIARQKKPQFNGNPWRMKKEEILSELERIGYSILLQTSSSKKSQTVKKRMGNKPKSIKKTSSPSKLTPLERMKKIYRLTRKLEDEYNELEWEEDEDIKAKLIERASLLDEKMAKLQEKYPRIAVQFDDWVRTSNP